MRRTLLTGAAAALVAVGLPAPQLAAGAQEGCSPVPADTPVCPADGPAETAAFVDPSARVVGGEHVSLGHSVYVGPFAELVASAEAPVSIGPESDVQDNVSVIGARGLVGNPDEESAEHGTPGDPAPGAVEPDPGVRVGERVIMAHGSSVLGPAEIGLDGSEIPANPDGIPEVFLSFGARVDGAVLEINTGVSALARVGPGIVLRSGTLVLPGKDVTTQEEADDRSLGKVRDINEADVAFNEAVIEVNVTLAREYTELYREDPLAVHGVNVDPGGSTFNPERDLPSFAGTELAVPGHRNRIIGDVDLGDRFGQFDRVVGDDVALRADEGEPIALGKIAGMDDDVIFHVLEEADLVVGTDVRFGRGAIVHGGGRVVAEGEPEEPTVVGDGVTLEDEAIVFRSTIGDGATIGERSAVVGTDLPPDSVVPDRTVVLNGEVFGPVEW
ncbi:hypothetical protein OF117_19390 [Geodermatophilus sp. YIM 151500]|uniref:hypothetical protein n=1 Tax=Geodermatophilus sp. YIM 151500 TaxID=2984531 RepID=UPI0021E50927|nr:hypothetical protein [Geodermatophilus sp. YIM 151500]MCV2491514.1 hypothetical protein [Geodermatophilus sp. YIM 151500]